MRTQKTKIFDTKNKQYIPQQLTIEAWQSPQFNYKTLLSEQEQLKADRYRFTSDRNRYVLGHIAFRYLAAKYLNIQPAKVLIEKDKNNKPFIANEHNDLNFNISHSGNKILLTFDIDNRLLGIDVERIDKQYEFKPVIKDYFTNEEQRFILEENSRDRFFQVWTRKEALMKALGTGLTDEIKNINVLTDFIKVDSKTFKINTFQLHNNYLMSLAIENHNSIYSFWNTKNIFKNIK